MLNRTWQFWLGLGVSVLLLLVLFWQVDFHEIRQALSDANYVYLAPSIALYFVGVYFRAFRWRYLLQPLRPLAASRVYPVVVIGYMANNLLPARLGELVRAYYLARREQLSASSALGTVAVERVYDGMTLLAWAAIAGPALWLMGEFDGAGDTSRTTWIVLAPAHGCRVCRGSGLSDRTGGVGAFQIVHILADWAGTGPFPGPRYKGWLLHS